MISEASGEGEVEEVLLVDAVEHHAAHAVVVPEACEERCEGRMCRT